MLSEQLGMYLSLVIESRKGVCKMWNLKCLTTLSLQFSIACFTSVELFHSHFHSTECCNLAYYTLALLAYYAFFKHGGQL